MDHVAVFAHFDQIVKNETILNLERHDIDSLVNKTHTLIDPRTMINVDVGVLFSKPSVIFAVGVL